MNFATLKTHLDAINRRLDDEIAELWDDLRQAWRDLWDE